MDPGEFSSLCARVAVVNGTAALFALLDPGSGLLPDKTLGVVSGESAKALVVPAGWHAQIEKSSYDSVFNLASKQNGSTFWLQCRCTISNTPHKVLKQARVYPRAVLL